MARNWMDDTALVDAITGNLYDALPLLPKRLVHIDQVSHEFKMPFSHIQIMVMLSGGSMSISEISASLGIAKPNITPLLDSLRERGLLERVRSEKDRRIVNVHLLPEGEAMAAEIRQSISKQVREWPEGFSLSDIKRLNNALATLIEMGKALAEKEQG
ncbi:MAG: winged helix-turn-helix transcriptional regulator [Clostridia bacterium]|nr:winged helix-turn-helix transcriptional regulator [Clostridia bacterium]